MGVSAGDFQYVSAKYDQNTTSQIN